MSNGVHRELRTVFAEIRMPYGDRSVVAVVESVFGRWGKIAGRAADRDEEDCEFGELAFFVVGCLLFATERVGSKLMSGSGVLCIPGRSK